MTWRVAKSLLTLRDQINAAFPNRNKASDGTIGDTSHQNRNSDHNPWYGPGIVTAMDITHDPKNGVDIDRLTDELVASRDPRIKYIIANGLILDTRPGFSPWRWVKYTGPNAHTRHFHLSVMPNASCDSTKPWDLPSLRKGGGSTPTAPKPIEIEDEEDLSMELKPGRVSRYFRVREGKKNVHVACPHDEMAARIKWHGPKYPKTKGKFPLPGSENPDADWIANDDVNMKIHAMRPWNVKIPKGAVGFTLEYTYRPEGSRDEYVASLDFS